MKPRILVVDDESAIRELIVDFLTDEGYQVDYARDGKEAADKLSNTQYDAFIVDVMMPRLNGYGLLKVIRELPETHSTPVILMSALDASNSEEKAPTPT